MAEPRLVSVVMCTYNGSIFLDEQVETILNQDYKNLELIIVDDKSTDSTWTKLEAWKNKNERIRIYSNDVNIGYNKNFEKAILLATGDLIAISDQDDIWMPQKISKLVEALQPNDVVLAHSRSVRLENNRLRFKSASLHHHFTGNDTRRLFMFNQINGHDMIFKKELVQKFIPVPQGMMYDWWIAVVATCYGKIASVDEYLVHHRIHADNSFFTTDTSLRKRQLDLPEALHIFNSIQALNNEVRFFLNELAGLLQKRKGGDFDYRLFKFLYKNRYVIFGHKKRLLPAISYIKYAIKYAKLDYNGRGISI